MRYRRLGDSDISVSEIALGAWLTYAGGIGREQTEACTRAAFDAGITFFDTANAYGHGAAEEAWGEILSAYRRDAYVLATKAFFPMSDEDSGLSAAQVEKQLDASLRRLRTDYVDVYFCHRFDVRTPIEETIEALTASVRAGKVRVLGFSEWTLEQIRAGLGVADAERFAVSQPQYSMLWRAPEAELFPLCAEEGIGNVVFSPLAQGILTGKYRPGAPPPPDSRAADAAMNGWMEGRLDDAKLAAVQRLARVAEDAGLTLPQLALAWVLRRAEVSAAIVGASRPEQIAANVSAVGVALTDDVLRAADAALGEVPVTTPVLAGGAEEGVMHRVAGNYA